MDDGEPPPLRPGQAALPSDLTDEEWSLVEPLIPPAKRGGRKREVVVREVVNGVMYVLVPGATITSRSAALGWFGSATSSTIRQLSATADIRHLRRHHGHELDIRLERQAGHIGDPARDIVHVDACLRLDLAAGLQTASCRVFVACGRGIADVDLAAGDVVFASIERQ